MARKLQTNPRKLASQERSRSTVDALLEATARVLTKEGYDRASTNRIAEVAGGRNASLLPDFFSKEAPGSPRVFRPTPTNLPETPQPPRTRPSQSTRGP